MKENNQIRMLKSRSGFRIWRNYFLKINSFMNMNKFFKRHIFSKQYLFREKNNHKDLHRKEKSEGCAQRQKKKKSKIYYFFL